MLKKTEKNNKFQIRMTLGTEGWCMKVDKCETCECKQKRETNDFYIRSANYSTNKNIHDIKSIVTSALKNNFKYI